MYFYLHVFNLKYGHYCNTIIIIIIVVVVVNLQQLVNSFFYKYCIIPEQFSPSLQIGF